MVSLFTVFLDYQFLRKLPKYILLFGFSYCLHRYNSDLWIVNAVLLLLCHHHFVRESPEVLRRNSTQPLSRNDFWIEQIINRILDKFKPFVVDAIREHESIIKQRSEMSSFYLKSVVIKALVGFGAISMEF